LQPPQSPTVVIPAFDCVPGIARVALVLCLKRLEIHRGFRVADFIGIDAGGDRVSPSACSDPVPKLDVAVDEVGQFRLERLVLVLIVILIVVVAPARSGPIATVVGIILLA